MVGMIWREGVISTDMKDPLDELARRAGDDIYVHPIKGYGSYSANNASGGTDTGGGHTDIDLVGLNSEQKLRLERIAREIGFYADIREPCWYSKYRKKTVCASWQSHLHMLKKDTKDLSDAARKQLSQWYDGSNGLAAFEVNGVWYRDPDDGPREFLRQTWTQYNTLGDLTMTQFDELKALILGIPAATWDEKLLNDGSLGDDKRYPASLFPVRANQRANDLQIKFSILQKTLDAHAANSGTDAKTIADAVVASLKTDFGAILNSVLTEHGVPTAEEISAEVVNEFLERVANG
jgi:hypothetical protein